MTDEQIKIDALLTVTREHLLKAAAASDLMGIGFRHSNSRQVATGADLLHRHMEVVDECMTTIANTINAEPECRCTRGGMIH